MKEGPDIARRQSSHERIDSDLEARIARAEEDVADNGKMVIRLYDADSQDLATVEYTPANRSYYLRDYSTKPAPDQSTAEAAASDQTEEPKATSNGPEEPELPLDAPPQPPPTSSAAPTPAPAKSTQTFTLGGQQQTSSQRQAPQNQVQGNNAAPHAPQTPAAPANDAEMRRLAREQLAREQSEDTEELLRRLAARRAGPERSRTESTEPPRDETPRQRMDREYLEHHAKRSDFYPIEASSGNWTGRGERGGTVYGSNAMPGSTFTQSQVDAVERRELGQPPTPPPESPGRVATGPERGDAHEQPDWNTHIPAFRGLKVKTIDKLLADPEDQLFFGMLVESLDPSGLEIKRKMFSQERLSIDEKRIVNYARHEYARRLTEVAYVQSKLNLRDLEIAGARDQDLHAEIGFRGDERTLEIFKRQVKYQAMQNREAHERLFNTYRNLTGLRDTKRFRVWDAQVSRLCEKTGTPITEFDHVFKTGTRAERVASRRALQAQMRGEMGRFGRVWDRVSGGSFRRADRLVRKADRVERYLGMRGTIPRQVSDELQSLTGILRYTLVDNPEIDLMIQQEAARNEKLSPSAENGPTSYAEAKAQETPTSNQIRTELDAFATGFRHKDGRTWDYLTPTERTNALTGKRAEALAREHGTGQGWFARSMLAFARWIFSAKEQELINKETRT